MAFTRINGISGSASLYAGTNALTTTAEPLAATQAVSEVVVQSDPANSTNVLVGNSTAQTIVLEPGDAIVLPVADLALVYVKAVSGTPTVTYLGRS